jgi:NADPH:quinone reductase-like Zn-dependent oxidoreductase
LIRDAVAVKPGQRVLIDAAAGAVGSIAAQIAKGRGAEVIGMASGDDLNYVRSLGLAMVIDYKKERFEDRAGQVDAVVDLVGGETLARAYAIVKKGGVIVTSVYQMDEAKARAAGIRGMNFKMKWDSPDLVELAEMVQSGKVKPRMGRTLPLAQAAEAQRLSESGEAHGKLLLEIPT